MSYSITKMIAIVGTYGIVCAHGFGDVDSFSIAEYEFAAGPGTTITVTSHFVWASAAASYFTSDKDCFCPSSGQDVAADFDPISAYAIAATGEQD